jgi:multiple sugar transport system ATP-binding protein
MTCFRVRRRSSRAVSEPLSNLDAALRVQMRLEIERLHRELGTTMIYVTHDQVEAMTLADRIVALDSGRIQQIGAPLELYARPNNLFVAGFIGSPKMNMIPAKVVGVAGGSATVALDASAGSKIDVPVTNLAAGEAVTIGVRPEALEIIGSGKDVPTGLATLPARIEAVERLGNVTYAYLDGGTPEVITVQVMGDAPLEAGEDVRVGIRPSTLHVFNAGGAALAT